MNARVMWSVMVLYLALNVSASATNVSVNCTNPQTGTFPSITAALNSLDLAGPNVITVQGTCKENVFIFYYQRLTIQSAPGRTAVIENAANPAGIVLQAFGCRGLVLVNLVIQGGSVGLLVNQASEAVIQNLVVKDNPGDGIVAQIDSTLGVESSKSINNGGVGLTVASKANATLSTVPGETILVSGNGGNGVVVDAGYLQVNFGAIRVQHNAGAAVFVAQGELLMFGGNVAGAANVFQNNGEGIDLFDTSSARFFGSNLIQNNGEVGLQVVGGSSADFLAFTLADGTIGQTIVQGHSGPGVNVVRTSAATFNGPNVIRHNGSASDSLRSGTRIEHSNVTLVGTTITGNTGPGIVASESSTVNLLDGAVVRNNSEDGVRLKFQSNSGVSQPVTISGNGGSSVSCDASSLAFGDFTGIKNVNCNVQPEADRASTKSRVVLH
jgi:hypothetical protein